MFVPVSAREPPVGVPVAAQAVAELRLLPFIFSL